MYAYHLLYLSGVVSVPPAAGGTGPLEVAPLTAYLKYMHVGVAKRVELVIAYITYIHLGYTLLVKLIFLHPRTRWTATALSDF